MGLSFPKSFFLDYNLKYWFSSIVLFSTGILFIHKLNLFYLSYIKHFLSSTFYFFLYLFFILLVVFLLSSVPLLCFHKHVYFRRHVILSSFLIWFCLFSSTSSLCSFSSISLLSIFRPLICFWIPDCKGGKSRLSSILLTYQL